MVSRGSVAAIVRNGVACLTVSWTAIAGIAAPVQAWFGWIQIERALRLDRPLPAAGLTFPTGAAVAVAGILVFLGVVLA